MGGAYPVEYLIHRAAKVYGLDPHDVAGWPLEDVLLALSMDSAERQINAEAEERAQRKADR